MARMTVLPPLRVERVARVTRRVGRVTITGDGLVGVPNLLPAQHVRLLFPPDGERRLDLPRRENGGLTYAGDGPRPWARSMTVRRLDPVRGELDIDVVLHAADDAGTDSACTRWVRSVAPGDPVGVVGPGGGHLPPSDTAHLLLAGDTTALPAMAGLLAGLPAGVGVDVVAEVEDADDEQDLGVPVRWVHRSRGETLAGAVADWTPPTRGTVSAWVAGEGQEVRAAREHLRGVVGLDREHCHVLRYWTRGRTHEDSDATFQVVRREAARRGIDRPTTQDVHELSYELMGGHDRPGRIPVGAGPVGAGTTTGVRGSLRPLGDWQSPSPR